MFKRLSPRIYPVPFANAIVRIMDDLKWTRACHLGMMPMDLPTGPTIVGSMPDTDDFAQANLAECFAYLRGGKSLSLPKHWKDIFPSFLPERPNPWAVHSA